MFCTHCGHELGSSSTCPVCGLRSAYAGLSPFAGSPQARRSDAAVLDLEQPSGGAASPPSAEILATNVQLTSWIEALREVPRSPRAEGEGPSGVTGSEEPDDASAAARVTLDLPGPPAQKPLARLVPKGLDGGAAHDLFIGSHVLSGNLPAAIVIDDPYVSSPHARISVFVRDGETRVLVEDLDSKNHTYVDGKKVTRAEAPDGCTLRFASVEFILRTEAA